MDNKNEKKRTNRGLILVLAVLCMMVLCVAGSVLAKYAADVEAGKFQINITDNAPFSYTVQYMDGENELHVQQERDTKKSHVCTIIDTIPQKNGYAFLGWSANKNAETADYKAGDSMTLNYGGDHVTTIKRTLYAVWKISMPILETGRNFNTHTPAETTAVIFTDSAAPEGATLMDVSEAKDGGIVAWMEDTVMYVSTQRTGFPAYANPDSQSMFNGKKSLISVDTANLNTSYCENMMQMFFNCTSLKNIDVSRFDISNVTNISGMFYCCTALEELDVSKWNVSNVTTMRMIFGGYGGEMSLKSVGDLSGWDTSKVTNMRAMFQNCIDIKSVGNLSNWNVSNVTDMGWFFNKCISLTYAGDLSRWNTSKVTNMRCMFSECNKLAEVGDLDKWNTSKVTDMSFMFNGNLDTMALTHVGNLGNWDTSKVTDMSYMFSRCSNLTDIGDLSGWDTSKVTNMRVMFQNCKGIKNMGNLSNWDVSNVTDMAYMFIGCSNLTNIGDLGNWNVTKVTNMGHMFLNCVKLENIGDLSGWDVSNVTDMVWMFGSDSGGMMLSDIGDISKWDVSRVTNTKAMFQSCNKFTNIRIPSSLTVYGSFCFNHMSAYTGESFTVGKNVTRIGKSHVFYDFGTDDFKEFRIEDGNTSFTVIEGCLYTADGTRLIAVPRNKAFTNDIFEIPEGVTFMNELSFSRNVNSSTLVLPDSYTIRFCEVKDSEYDGDNINTGSNLAIALYCYTNVSQYKVKDSNPNYISKDGCIYSKDGSALIAVPDKYTGELSVADGTIAIEKTAIKAVDDRFMNRVTSIAIPASVTKIDEYAMEMINAIGCSITVDSANPNYTVVDGKLTTK